MSTKKIKNTVRANCIAISFIYLHINIFEMETRIIKYYGECRCCLAKGNHRDIMKEHYWNGTQEVFINIFMDCFNLYLSTNKNISTLICSTCVKRLRDASSFRSLVVNTERHLLDAFKEMNSQPEFVNVASPEFKEDNTLDVKLELDNIKEEEFELIASESDNDNICNFDSDNDGLVEGEAQLLARFASSLAPLPTRQTLHTTCPKYVEYLDAFKKKVIRPTIIEEFLLNPRITKQKNKIEISEKLAHVINACTILEFSNATAFKTKMRSGFPCFYCRTIFENLEILRDHQTVHPKSSLFKLLKKYTADEVVVYADVTDLKCTICNESVANINELKKHLTDTHGKRMYSDFTDRVIPFKLSNKQSDFECQICGFNFETFGAIERHMNVHYNNYICEECGAGFVTKHRLKVHAYMLHKKGNYPCESCKKIFPTYFKYKLHVDAVHNMIKKMKCPKCSERFIDYFTRQRHMEEKHGMAPILYKCNVCDRSFNRKYSLSSHMKRCHLEQKDVQCQYCSYMCYTKTELRQHMLKHGTEKGFECSVCNKSYARKKTLTEHMRIHNNDRRFTCSVCGQAFVQNCSLKGHMKTHHLDYVIGQPVQ